MALSNPQSLYHQGRSMSAPLSTNENALKLLANSPKFDTSNKLTSRLGIPASSLTAALDEPKSFGVPSTPGSAKSRAERAWGCPVSVVANNPNSERVKRRKQVLRNRRKYKVAA